MSKKGGGQAALPQAVVNASPATERLTNLQANMGQQLFGETTPLRQLLTGNTFTQIGGNAGAYNQNAQQQYNARTSALQQAVDAARQQVSTQPASPLPASQELFVQPQWNAQYSGKEGPPPMRRIPMPQQQAGPPVNTALNDAQAALSAHLAQGPTTIASQASGVDPSGIGRLGYDANITMNDVSRLPTYGVLKLGAEQQYADSLARARETLPQGGAYAQALGDLGEERARMMTQGGSALAAEALARRERAFENASQRALSLSTGLPVAGIQAVGNAGNTFANLTGMGLQAQMSRDQARAMESSAAKGGAGQVAGMALAKGMS